MDQILYSYYANNARKLHKIVDRILYKFGGIYGKDKDDFYSLANEVFVYAMRRYDGAQSFDGFLYSCLKNKILSEITKRNREKRRADRIALSIDAPVGGSENQAAEIQEALHMTPKEYTDALENMRSYEKIRILL